MNERILVNRALEAIRTVTNHEVTGKWHAAKAKGMKTKIDGQLQITLQGKTLVFTTEVKTELREYQLQKILDRAAVNTPFMVLAERIFPAMKEKLRANDIAYLDTAGNIYLRTDGTFIWLEGNKPVEPERLVTNRAFTKTGLKTVFYLLLHPQAVNMPYRALAERTGVGLGNVKNILEGLQEAGYFLLVNAKTKMLINKKALLDRWIAGYQETLKPTLLLGRYRFFNELQQEQWQKLPVKPGDTAWGGEPAAEVMTNYITPRLFTVYTNETRLKLMTQWKLVPDPNGTVTVYQKFWKLPPEEEGKFAPALLVYADLVLTADPRNLETAEMIYQQHLKDAFEQ